jgi:spermidine/putrescine transport system permease protein
VAGFVGDRLGNPAFRLLGTEVGVLIGIVYGYLPLMVFPLYVTLERMDRTLVEASKDLGAGRWATFRQVTLPIALPGLITGSILVFIPMMGEYVIPQILGYGQVYTIGNALVLRFLEARNWPAGAAYAAGLILVMLATITFYLWFTNRGRRTRDVSVL